MALGILMELWDSIFRDVAKISWKSTNAFCFTHWLTLYLLSFFSLYLFLFVCVCVCVILSLPDFEIFPYVVMIANNEVYLISPFKINIIQLIQLWWFNVDRTTKLTANLISEMVCLCGKNICKSTFLTLGKFPARSWIRNFGWL